MTDYEPWETGDTSVETGDRRPVPDPVRSDDPALRAMQRVADRRVRGGARVIIFNWYAGGYVVFVADGSHALWVGHHPTEATARAAAEGSIE